MTQTLGKLLDSWLVETISRSLPSFECPCPPRSPNLVLECLLAFCLLWALMALGFLVDWFVTVVQRPHLAGPDFISLPLTRTDLWPPHRWVLDQCVLDEEAY